VKVDAMSAPDGTTPWAMLDAALADENAVNRDLAASELDRRADTRDQTSHDRDVQASDLDIAALTQAPDSESDGGLLDRHRSAIDRNHAAGDRSQSRDDREHAALNRKDSGEDRRRAHQDREHMREALLSSNVIGQAQGFLMSSRSCTAEEAFGLLRTMSMQTNRKVRDIAHSLVETETNGS
jgi:hypothetical protein